jgi:sarcosine oxidase subunit gamma
MSDALMSDFPLTRRPAVDAVEPIRFGALALEIATEGSVLQLLGQPGKFDTVAAGAALAPLAPNTLRAAGPGQWFLVSEDPADIGQISERLAGIAYVMDQTHGRTRLRLRGPQVRQVLAKGTAVDLHREAFAIGHATMTLIGHIGANLTRTGEDEFELLVLRGFAESLWHELKVMSAEFA